MLRRNPRPRVWLIPLASARLTPRWSGPMARLRSPRRLNVRVGRKLIAPVSKFLRGETNKIQKVFLVQVCPRRGAPGLWRIHGGPLRVSHGSTEEHLSLVGNCLLDFRGRHSGFSANTDSLIMDILRFLRTKIKKRSTSRALKSMLITPAKSGRQSWQSQRFYSRGSLAPGTLESPNKALLVPR
jgi:hypothetical protein